MKITANGTEYDVTKKNHDWTLGTPIVVTDKETKEKKPGVKDSWHTTFGQCLAAISDKEMGKAKNLDDIIILVATLRKDLLNINKPKK